MFCLKLSEIHFKISRDLKERISETAEMQKKLEKQLPALDKVNKGGISEWHLLLNYNAPQDSGDLVWHFYFVGIFQKRRFWRQIAWWTSWIEQEAQSRQILILISACQFWYVFEYLESEMFFNQDLNAYELVYQAPLQLAEARLAERRRRPGGAGFAACCW